MPTRNTLADRRAGTGGARARAAHGQFAAAAACRTSESYPQDRNAPSLPGWSGPRPESSWAGARRRRQKGAAAPTPAADPRPGGAADPRPGVSASQCSGGGPRRVTPR